MKYAASALAYRGLNLYEHTAFMVEAYNRGQALDDANTIARKLFPQPKYIRVFVTVCEDSLVLGPRDDVRVSHICP